MGITFVYPSANRKLRFCSLVCKCGCSAKDAPGSRAKSRTSSTRRNPAGEAIRRGVGAAAPVAGGGEGGMAVGGMAVGGAAAGGAGAGVEGRPSEGFSNTVT